MSPGPPQGEVATHPDHEDPDLRTRVYAIPFQQVWTQANQLVTGRHPHWVLVDADDETGIIHAEASTPVLRSAADVEIRVGLDSDAQTRVSVVSRPRTSRWDLGTNARRVRRFLKALDDSLGEPAQRAVSSPRAAPSVAEPSRERHQS